MKVLFACTTVYQLLISYLIAKTIHKDKENIIVISDKLIDEVDEISVRLKTLDVFKKIVIINTNNKSKVELKKQLDDIQLNDIDIYHFTAFGSVICCMIYNEVCTKAKIILTDEGTSTYFFEEAYKDWLEVHNIKENEFNRESGLDAVDINYISEVWLIDERLYLGKKFNKCLKKINIYDFIKYDNKLREEMCKELNTIFNYKPIGIKWDKLFFDQNLAQCGIIPMGYEKIILKKMENIFVNSNIVFKTHPFEYKSKFKNLNLNFFNLVNVPWEVVYFDSIVKETYDVSKTYLTYYSTAPLFYRTIFGDNENSKNDKIIFLYKLLNFKPNKIKNVINNIEKMLNEYIKTHEDYNIYVPNSYQELCEILNITYIDKDVRELDYFNNYFRKIKFNNSVKHYLSEIFKMEVDLLKIKNNNKYKYLIWGAGENGLLTKQIIDDILPNFKIVGYIDKFKKGKIQNIDIYQPSQIDKIKFDYVFIATSGGRDEAENILESMGLNVFEHYFYVI